MFQTIRSGVKNAKCSVKERWETSALTRAWTWTGVWVLLRLLPEKHGDVLDGDGLTLAFYVAFALAAWNFWAVTEPWRRANITMTDEAKDTLKVLFWFVAFAFVVWRLYDPDSPGYMESCLNHYGVSKEAVASCDSMAPPRPGTE